MMTSDELKAALRTRCPVIWRGEMEYERARGYISAIITTYKDGAYQIAVEITDRRGNITRVKASQVTLYEGELK
jgi:hypothetical protein